MKNSFYTYGFLSIMGIALISLAVLQYKWLGSVSEAEKERLEESLSASAENFVADFNEVFTTLGHTFRIQVSNPNEDIETGLGDSYGRWIGNSKYPDLIDSIYVLKKSNEGDTEIFAFSSDPNTLRSISPSNDLQRWIENDAKSKVKNNQEGSLNVNTELGNPTFLPIPVQFLDMIQVSNREFGQKVEVQLSIDQLDDIVLLKLDDNVIKQKLIPSIARVYFSDSYEDQYTLSLLKDEQDRVVYYTSGDAESIPKPDFKSSLSRFNLNNILIFQSNSYSGNNVRFPNVSDSIKIGFKEFDFIEESNFDTTTNGTHEVRSHFFSQNKSNLKASDTKEWSVQRDTSFRTSVSASMGNTTWQLWLSFKEGSLDAFVNKTRNRNLGISFGILSILGISVVLIVVFSQRSRELAEQQMLFVAGVSHELRTPITVIRSAAENLNEGFVHDEKRKQEYAKLMLKEGRRLSDMVDQIMEFSGIQTGKRVYHITEVFLSDLLQSIKEENHHLLDERGMNLEYSINTKRKTIQADPDAIFLSLTNLIHNAIKFSGDKGKVLLKVDEVEYRGNPALRVQVQDFGFGIPDKEQSLIFKPFFRGEKPVSDQVKGNGIGLSLVQKVAKAHGGEITVKSKVGVGSTFSLILPLGFKNG